MTRPRPKLRKGAVGLPALGQGRKGPRKSDAGVKAPEEEASGLPPLLYCKKLVWDEPAEGCAARVHHSMVHWNGALYVFGGSEGAKRSGGGNVIWEYTLFTGRWCEYTAKKGKAPARREGHTAVVYKGCMFIYGGHRGTAFYDDLTCFNLSERQWIKLEGQAGSPTPGGRFGHSAIVAKDQMW
eukprot:Hpha_TRINITY_DN2132_c1_g1::TRINITY_DN2132_c1_g1_i1::g.42318::m.42318